MSAFHLIAYQEAACAPVLHLIVDGHGVEQGMLTVFYSHLQQREDTLLQSLPRFLRSFDSFEHARTWDGPPSVVQEALHTFLINGCGCILVESHDHVLVFTHNVIRVQQFLALLTRFYCFAIKKYGYWYSYPLEKHYDLFPLWPYLLFKRAKILFESRKMEKECEKESSTITHRDSWLRANCTKRAF